MVCEPEHRLGKNGAGEIKKHAFFRGFNWDNVKSMKAPYVPNVSSEISNENFDKFDEEDQEEAEHGKGGKKIGFAGRKLDMNFIGYTYKADVENEKSMLVNVLKDLDQLGEITSSKY